MTCCCEAKVQSREDRAFCVNKQMRMEEVDRMIDRRYSIESKFFLRFVSASVCKSTYVKLTNQRDLYYKTKRVEVLHTLDTLSSCFSV